MLHSPDYDPGRKRRAKKVLKGLLIITIIGCFLLGIFFYFDKKSIPSPQEKNKVRTIK